MSAVSCSAAPPCAAAGGVAGDNDDVAVVAEHLDGALTTDELDRVATAEHASPLVASAEQPLLLVQALQLDDGFQPTSAFRVPGGQGDR